jgi:hypothetical protein
MFFGFGLIRKAVMAPPPEYVTAEYPSSGKPRHEKSRHLDRVCKVVVHVMGSTLEQPTLWHARFLRETVDTPYRGFAVEGIAMGLALTELTNPFSRSHRALEFADDLEGRYRVLANVGIGMALGRLNRDLKWAWTKMRPDSRDFVLDGYGFARGFFNRKRYIDRHEIPSRLTERDLPMFDEGLGRLIWITSDLDVARVATKVGSFAANRQPALWAGVGVACTYTGVCNRSGYELLSQLAGAHYPALARGCALACYQRAKDEYVPDFTDVAASVFWNASAQEVAERFNRHLTDSSTGSSENASIFSTFARLERDAPHRLRSTANAAAT